MGLLHGEPPMAVDEVFILKKKKKIKRWGIVVILGFPFNLTKNSYGGGWSDTG
jgi:hypothetical protein